MAMILGYWDIRGLAHAIRLLLEYTDSHYEEKKYAMGDAPNYDRSQWLNEKFKLDLDFPNVGRQKRRSVAWTFWRMRLWTPAYTLPGCATTLTLESEPEAGDGCSVPQEKLKPGYLEGLPDKMKLYSQFLGKRPWFAGEKLTYVDFLAYDILDILRIFEPKCLDAFPNLKEFMARFEGLKKISAYTKSSRFLPAPLFLKIAVWGSK